MKKGPIAIIAVAIVVLVIISSFVGSYNSLVSMRESVSENFMNYKIKY